MPRARYIFEAVFKHLGLQVDIQEMIVSSGCPKDLGTGSRINSMTFDERLNHEKELTEEDVDDFL